MKILGNSKGTLALTNRGTATLRVRLEPWATEATIEPTRTLGIAYRGPDAGRLEIELSDGDVVIYGWEGAILSFDSPS
jgi:hypothetical protein